MVCFGEFDLERRVRRFWCVGGPQTPIEEVAFYVGCSVKTLRYLLNHIPHLDYHSIRYAGQEILFRTNSSAGKALGFLADGDAFDILTNDRLERDRLARERMALLRV